MWEHEKALNPARKIKIPGVRSTVKKLTRWAIAHTDLGKVTTHMRGKETWVFREIVTINDGSKLQIDVGARELEGCTDPIQFRIENLRRFLEKRQIDLQPLIDKLKQ